MDEVTESKVLTPSEGSKQDVLEKKITENIESTADATDKASQPVEEIFVVPQADDNIDDTKETVIESINVKISDSVPEGDEDVEETPENGNSEEGSEDDSSTSSSDEKKEIEEEPISVSIETLDPTSENYIKYPDTSLIDISQIFYEEIEEPEPEDELDENGFFRFPKLKNPGLDAAYNYVCPPPVFKDNGIERYIYICESLKVFPIKRFVDSLKGSVVNLRYYGVDSRSVRAIAEALKNNKTVTVLDLEDNWLTPDAVFYLGEMLQENLKLAYLNLTGCRIGPEGASKIKEGISGVRTLEELNLSWNNLGDEGMEELAEALRINYTIKKLDLSHNKLGNDTSLLLVKIMEDNQTLEDLNLSYNDLYPASGLKLFLIKLISSPSLMRLNLAWNALTGRDTAKAFKSFIAKSEMLTHLNVSNNRFEGRTPRAFKAGMMKSVSLQWIDLSYNPIRPGEANALVSVFNNPNSRLVFLGIEDIWVEKNFINTLTNARRLRDELELNFEVKFAGVYSNYEISEPDPNKLMFARAIYEGLKPKKKKKKREFGHVVLTLAEYKKPHVGMERYKELVKSTKIKLDDNLVLEIGKSFGVGKNKVDLVGLKDYFMTLYPDTVLPEKKPKKKKGKGRRKAKKKKEE